MDMAVLAPLLLARHPALESASYCHQQNKSPLQNLGHAWQATPLEIQLAQAHSLQLRKQQSSE